MSFMKKTAAQVRTMPKAVWIAAVILPFGLAAVGAWITGRSIYETRKKNKETK